MKSIYQGVEPPKSRCVVWKSNFQLNKSTHSKIIGTHYLNHRLDLLIPFPSNESTPTSDDSTKERGEKLKKELNSILNLDKHFFYVMKICPALLYQLCCTIHEKKCYVYGTSILTTMESGNLIAIHPNGKILLSLDKETYQHFGLNGTVTNFRYDKKDKNRYVVHLDYTLNTASKMRKRTEWALERLSDCHVLMSIFKDDPTTLSKQNVPIESFPTSSFSYTFDEQVQNEIINKNPIQYTKIKGYGEYSSRIIPSLPFPDKILASIPPNQQNQSTLPSSSSSSSSLASSSSSLESSSSSSMVLLSKKHPHKDKVKTVIEKQVDMMQYYLHWIGTMTCEISKSNIFSGELKKVIFSSGKNGSLKPALFIRLVGFIPPHIVENITVKIRQHMKQYHNEKSNPSNAATILVTGFEDSVSSWNEEEHRNEMSGENDYAFVVFPNDDYWCLQALGQKDMHS